MDPGQTYSYAVYTMDIAGNLTRQPAKVTGSTVDTTPPGPVTDLKVSGATASSVTLTWSNPASSDLDEVLVRRAKGSTPPADPAAGTAVPLADETATSATDTALLPTTSYSYAVFTRDRSGNTNPSPVTVTATTAKALAGAQVTTGFRHSCGLDAVGTAWCWGWNGFGQLGDGTVTDSSTPVKVSGDRVYDAISAGNDHTCAIDTDGAAWCWGRNSSGQLGDGTLEKRSMPVAVQGGRAFRDISGGSLQTCALDTDGAAWCWGHNSDGQLGDGSTATRTTTPVAVAGGHRFSEISSGLHHTCGLDASGGTVRCWGRNSSGQLGDTTTEPRTRPAAVAGTYRAVTAGDTHTCAIDTDAAAWCWGSNTAGQIGDDTISDLRSAPTAVLGERAYSTIVGGGLHTCALATDGKPWCWGSNRYGELGVGVPIVLSRTPVAVEPAGSGAFDTIAAGGGPDGGQTCGIDTAGAAWCWGWNSSGQLGDTTTEDRYSPSAVTPASG